MMMGTKRQYIPRNFGAYLKKKRTSLKLSQNKLARISGVKQSMISRYELGHIPWPKLNNFFALLEVIEK